VLEAVQDEFFVRGRALDEPGVLAAVSDRLGVDGPAVELFARSERALELAREDVALAKELDPHGGPMLLASRGQRLFEFDGPGASSQRLVDQFRTVLERS
jgi:predicted DsbA family dithiol-disulfide isomerase